jgi:hypothetical protein
MESALFVQGRTDLRSVYVGAWALLPGHLVATYL